MEQIIMTLINYITRYAAAGLGIIWAWICPTIPFILVCFFLVLVDCVSAYRLSVRVSKAHPDKATDGKFRSEHAKKIFDSLGMIFLVILSAQAVDVYLLSHINLYLGNLVAAAFCAVQLVSILENESSCNGNTWAKVVQKVLADKTKRHLSVDIETLVKEAKEEQRREDQERYY